MGGSDVPKAIQNKTFHRGEMLLHPCDADKEAGVELDGARPPKNKRPAASSARPA